MKVRAMNVVWRNVVALPCRALGCPRWCTRRWRFAVRPGNGAAAPRLGVASLVNVARLHRTVGEVLGRTLDDSPPLTAAALDNAYNGSALLKCFGFVRRSRSCGALGNPQESQVRAVARPPGGRMICINVRLCVSILSSALLAAACVPQVPEGRYRCRTGRSGECPAGWTCRALDESGEGLCYRRPGDPSAVEGGNGAGGHADEEDENGGSSDGSVVGGREANPLGENTAISANGGMGGTHGSAGRQDDGASGQVAGGAGGGGGVENGSAGRGTPSQPAAAGGGNEPVAGTGSQPVEVEICGNGRDDDGDQLIDCADPACTELRCIPEAPGGWLGPFSLFTGSPSKVPECPAQFPRLVLDGFSGLKLEPARCSACSCTAQGVCKVSDVSGYTGTCSVGQPNAYVSLYDNPTCRPFDSDAAVNGTYFYGPSTSGSCASSPQTPVVPPASWSVAARACVKPLTQADGCKDTFVCMPTPPNSFEPGRYCISQRGDASCPKFYSIKRTFHQSAADTRSCSDCGCSYIKNYCSGTVLGYADGSCAAPVVSVRLPILTSPSCASTGAARWFSWNPDPIDHACENRGGQPTGSITESDPVTVCCSQ